MLLILISKVVKVFMGKIIGLFISIVGEVREFGLENGCERRGSLKYF